MRPASPGPTSPSTASPSDLSCCSWPSSCAPPGPGPAPHRRRPWRPWRPARTVKPFAPSSKREPKSSPSPVRSHLPRCRGVNLLAVGHQLPLVRRVGAFQGPYQQVRSSDAHTGPPHRRHRPQARQRRRPPHRPATTGTPSRRIRSASPHRTPRRSPVMIQAHQLTKRYGDKTAVHTLSFTIAPGIFALIIFHLVLGWKVYSLSRVPYASEQVA